MRKCDACKTAISSIFSIPSTWWSDCCKRANGYFGFEEIPDSTEEDADATEDDIDGCGKCYSYRY